MSNMKCPFCQQELDNLGYYLGGTPKLFCNNCILFGDNKLFEELIRTRKALDVAVDALNAGKTLADIAGFKMLVAGLEEALNKIKDKEQQ